LPMVMDFVAEFMSPKDMLKFAFLSKSTMNVFSTGSIVKNALCYGNSYTKTSAENLLDVMTRGSIFPPSPARLIRLFNAVRCEFCKTNRIKNVKANFGVCICFKCLISGNYTALRITKLAKNRQRNIEMNDLLTHTRVATHFHGYSRDFVRPNDWYGHWGWGYPREETTLRRSKVPQVKHYFVWRRHTFDSSGENIGAIVTATHLEEMMTLRRMDEVHRFIDEGLEAPSLDAYAEFVDVVHTYRRIAFLNNKCRLDFKFSRKLAFRQRKLAAVEKMIAKLRAKISDLGVAEEGILDYTVIQWYMSGSNRWREECVCMTVRPIRSLLQPFIKAPSKLQSKAKMEEIAQEIANISERWSADWGEVEIVD
jgi:hypothetical protein